MPVLLDHVCRELIYGFLFFFSVEVVVLGCSMIGFTDTYRCWLKPLILQLDMCN